MTPMIPGFAYQRVAADGIELAVAVGGSGDPIMLLHGFPQTHLMWRHVATDLSADHTVICPDLRGYGGSDKPAAEAPGTYAKRTMAADIVALARALGHEPFALAGHDRGALVAIRAGLDHPDAVTHLAALDVLPTLDMWAILHGVDASVAFHLYLMAQPAGLPETMISASADAFFGHFLDIWGASSDTIPADVRAEYLTACANAVPSIVADYRASATIDIAHDTADRDAGRTLTMPVTVIQQDWGSALGLTQPGYGMPGHLISNIEPPKPVTSWPNKRPLRSAPRSETCSHGESAAPSSLDLKKVLPPSRSVQKSSRLQRHLIGLRISAAVWRG